MTRADPNSWPFPTWHPDWQGDFQFVSLRAFAVRLVANTDLGVRLDVIEEGYARLVVFSGDTPTGEVYVSGAAGNAQAQYTIFAGAAGDELQTTDVAAGVDFLSERRTPYPEDAA